MDFDRQKQRKIIANTNQYLHNTENKRMLLRFQRGVADLENNRFTILQNTEFVDKLIDYLFTLYQKGHEGNIIKVLEKIGLCACSTDKTQRERAVFILSVFTEKVSQEKENAEFLEAVSRLLVNWLKIETEYLSGFEFVCTQLQKMLQRMLEMGLWYQAENLIIVLSQIQSGVIQKNNLIRKTINKVHSGLANDSFLKSLINVYLDKQEDRRDIAECLLMHFGSRAAVALVQTLIDCQDKEKRFSLLEFIPTTGKVVIQILDRCLGKNPPWFVIRNVIIIISRLDDPTLYSMVRPYLVHKDIRVQQQVLNCISRMGGVQMRERLIEALYHINDELKQQVVMQLGNMGGKDVGDALCDLLEKRDAFAMHIQDELLLALCSKIKFAPSDRAIKVVRELLNERNQRFGEGDRVMQAAQDAFLNLELKTTTGRGSGLLSPATSASSDMPEMSEAELDALLTTNFSGTREILAPQSLAFEPLQKEEKLAEDILASLEPKADAVKESSPQSPPAIAPAGMPEISEAELDALLNDSFSSTREIFAPQHLPSEPPQQEELPSVSPTPKGPSKEDIIREAERNLTDLSSANHFTIWTELYEEMTTEEFIAFHDALKHKSYQPDELIVASGDLQAPLFFFDRGTVNLVRTVEGEEIHMTAMGAGDLIGSDIFLTGEPWNVSLYAREEVQAHVFDLEDLLKLQVDFPHLAEKLFTFCSGYDVLPALLRILDTPEPQETERTRILRDDMPKKKISEILKKLKGGLCFSLPVKAAERIDILLENQLRLGIRLSTGIVRSLSATIVGTMRVKIRPEEAIVFVRFFQPLPDPHYKCENIEFPESV